MLQRNQRPLGVFATATEPKIIRIEFTHTNQHGAQEKAIFVLRHIDDFAEVSVETLSGTQNYNCDHLSDFIALKHRFGLPAGDEERHWIQSRLLRFFHSNERMQLPEDNRQNLGQRCLFGKLDSDNPGLEAQNLVQYCLLNFFHLDGRIHASALNNFYCRNSDIDFYAPLLFHDRQIAELWLHHVSNTHPISFLKIGLLLMVVVFLYVAAMLFLMSILTNISILGGLLALTVAYGIAFLSTYIALHVLWPPDQNKIDMVKNILEHAMLQEPLPVQANAQMITREQIEYVAVQSQLGNHSP